MRSPCPGARLAHLLDIPRLQAKYRHHHRHHAHHRIHHATTTLHESCNVLWPCQGSATVRAIESGMQHVARAVTTVMPHSGRVPGPGAFCGCGASVRSRSDTGTKSMAGG